MFIKPIKMKVNNVSSMSNLFFFYEIWFFRYHKSILGQNNTNNIFGQNNTNNGMGPCETKMSLK